MNHESISGVLNSNQRLASYPPAQLENWYRHNYFANDIDISGSGVENYTFKEIQQKANFSFNELDERKIDDTYTVGTQAVRQLIADTFGTGDPDEVMVSNGANEGLQLVIRSLLEPGDELITLGPCYHCHDKIAESFNCIIKKWVIPIESSDEALDIENLESLVSKKTKALCLNFPHNPTGKSISQGMLDKIVELCRQNNLYLIWDAVFQELVYEKAALKDPITQYARTVTLGTFSKAYGAPGLRFGWVIGPPQMISSCVRQKDYGNLFVAPLIEFVAEKMLLKLHTFSAPRLKQAASNREYVNKWVQSSALDISWQSPEGGVCGVIKLPKNSNDVDLCKKLLIETGVLLVPGSCFDIPGYARLGFGGNSGEFKEGLNRLENYLSENLT